MRPKPTGVVLLVAQIGLIALVVAGPRSAGPAPAWPEPWRTMAAALGAILGMAGAVLCLAGVRELGATLSPFPEPRSTTRLARSGAYGIVRHPIYAGLLLMAFGWGLFVQGSLTLTYAVALLLVLDLKSRYEERWLAARFEEYRDYQKEVRRLIPFVY